MNSNQETFNETNKRKKLTTDAVPLDLTNNDEMLDQGGTKRKSNVYCAHSRKKRTNIMLSDLQKKATHENSYVHLDNL